MGKKIDSKKLKKVVGILNTGLAKKDRVKTVSVTTENIAKAFGAKVKKMSKANTVFKQKQIERPRSLSCSALVPSPQPRGAVHHPCE